MSLRWIHLIFVLVVLIATDLFGAWAVWSYVQTGEGVRLAAGIASFIFGFAAVVYAIWVVRELRKVEPQ